nr:putative nuclease [uncultured Mediterranean phage uvMED]BAR31587.1 putative nuclease [uncultured Mediterranean phage uvMED]
MGDTNNKSKQLTKSSGKPTKLSTNIKGTIGEYQEIVNLTRQGYWVAKACDPQCPFDLVTVTPNGKIQLLDIKTNTYRKNVKSYRRKIWRTPTAKQKKLGIKIIMVDHANK